MSISPTLYLKGAFSDSYESGDEVNEEEDIWDDSKLNNAYDKALKIANEEVARRVAMSTNTAKPKEGNACNSKPKVKSHHEITKWLVGMNCRAVYNEDGIEYEAVVLRIINNKECVIKFLGYDNTELVPLKDLLPSLGNAERTRQIQESIAYKIHGSSEMECSDQPSSPGSATFMQRKKKSSKKKNKQKQAHGFEFPDIPMPNLAQFSNLSPPEMPPPPLLLTGLESEDQALSSMLLSWYMSGYYTGLYQGIKRAREVRK